MNIFCRRYFFNVFCLQDTSRLWRITKKATTLFLHHVYVIYKSMWLPDEVTESRPVLTHCLYLCRLLITFENSLDPNQARQNVWHSASIPEKLFFEIVDFKKEISRRQNSMKNFPRGVGGQINFLPSFTANLVCFLNCWCTLVAYIANNGCDSRRQKSGLGGGGGWGGEGYQNNNWKYQTNPVNFSSLEHRWASQLYQLALVFLFLSKSSKTISL